MLILLSTAAFAHVDGSALDVYSEPSDSQGPPHPHPQPPVPPPMPPKPPKPPKPPWPPGPPPSIVTQIVSNSASGTGAPVQAVVDCGEGMVVTGGGVNCTIGDNNASLNSRSCPTTNSTSPAQCDVPNGSSARYWTATCMAIISPEVITTHVYAVCIPAAGNSN